MMVTKVGDGTLNMLTTSEVTRVGSSRRPMC